LNTTTLVSQASGVGVAVGDGASSQPTISGDGQFVAFTSASNNLTTDPDPAPSQIFLRDTQLNTTTLVSQPSGVGVAVGDGASTQPTISSSGQFVAFTSLATTLVPTVVGTQVFSRNTQANTTSLVSQTAIGGSAGDGASSQPSISAAGGFVAFSSLSTNLGAAGGGSQIYVRALP
jgi:Tol biopolymer transport system component